MNAADFVHHYGYLAVLAGTFFEGEMVMLAAGVATSAGILSLPLVILAGMTGIFASDTFCFLLGRLAGARIQRWFPRCHARLGGVFHLIERHQDKLIVCFQFFPGLCTVTPIAFGMTRISTARFMALDLVGNASWTLVFSLGGYVFGEAFARVLREANCWELVACGVLALGGVMAWRVGRAARKRTVPATG